MRVYADSSALIKRYVQEADSDRLADLMVEAESIGSSLLGMSEVVSGIARGRRTGVLPDLAATEARAQFEREASDFVWFAIDRGLVQRAAGLLWKHELRSSDAIHLATALRWGAEDLLFATFDHRLAEAVRAEGLTVWP